MGVIYTDGSFLGPLGQTFRSASVMPTLGSPAYAADLFSSREFAHQEWAKPFFQN